MTVIPREPPSSLQEGDIGLPNMTQVLGFLLHWWALVIIGMVLSGGIAALIVLLPQQPVYEATARVSLLRYRTAANFEPRVKTVATDGLDSSGDSASLATQAIAQRRQELAELVVSPEIERDVIAKLDDQLPVEERSPGSLSGTVKGGVANSGLINIMVLNPSPKMAQLVANTWAEVYENRINRLYIGVRSSLREMSQGVAAAWATYAKAEEALTAFTASSPLKELSRSVADKEQLLTAADKARLDAVTDLASAETKAKQEEVARVLLAEASNRAMTLQREQEAKNKVLAVYMDASVEAKLAVLNEQTQGRRKELASLYATNQQVALLLDRAQALGDDLANGGGSGNALALTLLKAQAFSSSQALPQNLQLQIGEDTLRLSAQDQAAQVQSLIQALQQWRGRLAVAIDAKSKELLEGTGYSDISSDLIPKALADQVRKDYLSLFQLGEISRLSRDVPDDNPLTKEAREQASNLMQIPSVQQALNLQLQKTEYDDLKARLEAQIRGMNEKIAVESAQQKNLILQRDIAWDSYTALSRKTQELQVELLSPQQQEVQVTGEAVVKLREATGSPVLTIAQAAFLGLIISLIVAFVADRISVALPLARRERSALLGRN